MRDEGRCAMQDRKTNVISFKDATGRRRPALDTQAGRLMKETGDLVSSYFNQSLKDLFEHVDDTGPPLVAVAQEAQRRQAG